MTQWISRKGKVIIELEVVIVLRSQ